MGTPIRYSQPGGWRQAPERCYAAPAACVPERRARAQVIRGEGLIYMVMEYGDIDLARLLARHEATQRERGALEPDENFIRMYWQQMLQARAGPTLPYH